jgi:hypothetical protein
MPDNKMLIVPADLIKKINDNRGDLSQADFITFLIDERLGNKDKGPGDATREEIDALKKEIKKYVAREELQVFQEDTKKLIKSFLDFFIGYGLELNKAPDDLKELTKKLDMLDTGGPSEPGAGREVKIKWK